jgi:hypothetical protein
MSSRTISVPTEERLLTLGHADPPHASKGRLIQVRIIRVVGLFDHEDRHPAHVVRAEQPRHAPVQGRVVDPATHHLTGSVKLVAVTRANSKLEALNRVIAVQVLERPSDDLVRGGGRRVLHRGLCHGTPRSEQQSEPQRQLEQQQPAKTRGHRAPRHPSKISPRRSRVDESGYGVKTQQGA